MPNTALIYSSCCLTLPQECGRRKTNLKQFAARRRCSNRNFQSKTSIHTFIRNGKMRSKGVGIGTRVDTKQVESWTLKFMMLFLFHSFLLILFAIYAMLMRPKKAETAVRGCKHSGSLFFMLVFMGKARYQRCHSAKLSSFKLATSTFVLSILFHLWVVLLHNTIVFTMHSKYTLDC